MATCWNLLSKYGDFGNASDVGIAWDAIERERERERDLHLGVCFGCSCSRVLNCEEEGEQLLKVFAPEIMSSSSSSSVQQVQLLQYAALF